jgi:antibiotic biosynthesis monooxygenase (ABM) superfamily enzyme
MAEKQATLATPRPPRYKQAVITWLGVYPALTLILAVLGPTMESWPLPFRTLLVSVVMVIVLTWLILPFLMRILGAGYHGQTDSAMPRASQYNSPTCTDPIARSAPKP